MLGKKTSKQTDCGDDCIYIVDEPSLKVEIHDKVQSAIMLTRISEDFDMNFVSLR